MLKLIIGNKNYSSWSLRPWVALRMADVPFEEELQPFVDHGSHDKFRATRALGSRMRSYSMVAMNCPMRSLS